MVQSSIVRWLKLRWLEKSQDTACLLLPKVSMTRDLLSKPLWM